MLYTVDGLIDAFLSKGLAGAIFYPTADLEWLQGSPKLLAMAIRKLVT